MSQYDYDTQVLIAGGGPVGLSLALELEMHGVSAGLCEKNPQTTQHPKMDITNGRTMELFRRLGISKEIRAKGVAQTEPFSVVWATDLKGWELARFEYPTVKEMWQRIKADKTATLTAQPYMRISQVIMEPVLKTILERQAGKIDLKFGWGLESFSQTEKGVNASLTHYHTRERKTVSCQYLIGCDGAKSRVRRGLGIEIDEISAPELVYDTAGLRDNFSYARKMLGRKKTPPSGRLYIIHFTSHDKALSEKFGTAWHLQSPSKFTLISQNGKDVWTIHIPITMGQDPDKIDPYQLLYAALGREIEADIHLSNAWQPQLGLAQTFGDGRVWLAGDSAHQFIPTGGYGMNTGIADAAGLAWKLAALIQGWGGERLLACYNYERRKVSARNLEASKLHASQRIKILQAETPDIYNAAPKGITARQAIGEKITQIGNLENEAWGIEYGYDYQGSPLICPDLVTPTAPQKDDWAQYHPSTRPGERAPSLWLDKNTALFDLFDPKAFTLLCLGKHDVTPFEKQAKKVGLPLSLCTPKNTHIREIYGYDLILIRPDQHIAWRGDAVPDNIVEILDIVRGA